MKKDVPENYWNYLGKDTRPADLAAFWEETLEEVRAFELYYTLIPMPQYQYINKEVAKIVFQALDGTEIIGWYIRSSDSSNTKCLVTTHGYRSSKKEPHLYLHWLDIGYDVLAFDVRLQGGETGCNTPLSGPMSEVIALNILDLPNSYLRLIHTDFMLASLLPERLGYASYVLEGTSQAGGLVVAIGCLMGTASAVLANVPSNSDLDQRVLQGTGSFKAFGTVARHEPEILARIQHHLSYFDTKNLAERLEIPLFASVGGKDNVCPAQSFFATYNRVKAPKEINYYPFSGHEGGGSYQTELELNYLRTLL